MLYHCKDLEDTSSLSSTDQSKQDMLFSSISSDHSALEGNENKSNVQSNVVNLHTTISNSTQLQNNKETDVNRTKTNPSNQFVDYNVKSDFTHRNTYSRANHNSKQLILDNYLSTELQTDIVISKDALFKYRVNSQKHAELSENILNSLNKEPKKLINWRFNDDDEDNIQHKNIGSATGDYLIRNEFPFVEQNIVLTSFYEAKPKHFKQNMITKIED